MLILENLSFQTAKKAFMNSSKKLIKFEINNELIQTKKTAKVKSQTLVEWPEPVSLPLHLMTEYRFEIYEQHRFGYNPEELSSVAIGKFTIDSDDSFNTWEVTSDRGNKLGFLSAKIRKKMRYEPKAPIAEPEAQILSISSIIAHVSTLKQRRGYVVISLAGRSYQTEISKSKTGQLLFTEPIHIEKNDQIVEAHVEVFSYDSRQDKRELLGSGMLNLDPENLEKRVIMKNDKGADLGEVFIDYKLESKEVFIYGKELARIIQQRSRVNSSKIDHLANISASRTLNASRLYDSSLMHRPLKKSERNSVVNQNTKIFTPTEERFKNYHDKPSHIVSYIKEQQSMDFKDGHAKMYYRGASIGMGDKSNFTKDCNVSPGVGVYRLPSIWDRY